MTTSASSLCARPRRRSPLSSTSWGPTFSVPDEAVVALVAGGVEVALVILLAGVGPDGARAWPQRAGSVRKAAG